MKARRVFLYVQHLLGIGHLVRSNRLAEAMADHGFEVTVAMGGLPVAGFPGPRVRVVQLPPVKAGRAGFSALEDAAGNAVDESFKAKRVQHLLGAFRDCRPDALIIEAFPFGRRVMRFELLPLLEAARNMPRRPLIASSVRDILQETTKPGRAEETVEAVEKYFDCVLVHGDPRFMRLDETFPLSSAISKEIHHTGLVAGPVPAHPQERFDIVISAGGGAAGLPLLRAASEMIRDGNSGFRCCLITGPNLPQAEIDKLQSNAIADLAVHAFRHDFPDLLRGVRLSISQAGYNTVCDILRAGCRSLLIPFTAGGETEQRTRAARLATLGISHLLPEEGITSRDLAAAVQKALTGPPPPANVFDLEGARHSAEFLRSRLPA